jgi:hypothetical protein
MKVWVWKKSNKNECKRCSNSNWGGRVSLSLRVIFFREWGIRYHRIWLSCFYPLQALRSSVLSAGTCRDNRKLSFPILRAHISFCATVGWKFTSFRILRIDCPIWFPFNIHRQLHGPSTCPRHIRLRVCGVNSACLPLPLPRN